MKHLIYTEENFSFTSESLNKNCFNICKNTAFRPKTYPSRISNASPRHSQTSRLEYLSLKTDNASNTSHLLRCTPLSFMSDATHNDTNINVNYGGVFNKNRTVFIYFSAVWCISHELVDQSFHSAQDVLLISSTFIRWQSSYAHGLCVAKLGWLDVKFTFP